MNAFLDSAYAGLFAYVGPDTFLPLTSVLSALLGTALLLWGSGWRLVRRWLTLPVRREERRGVPAPHASLRSRVKPGASSLGGPSSPTDPADR